MPERYRVLLVDVGADTPAAVRLRRALKLFLRRFNLRAVEVLEVPEGPGGAPGQVRPGGARGPTGPKGV
jgi:hypothetical protein